MSIVDLNERSYELSDDEMIDYLIQLIYFLNEKIETLEGYHGIKDDT